jgi:hypothetical protein
MGLLWRAVGVAGVAGGGVAGAGADGAGGAWMRCDMLFCCDFWWGWQELLGL